MKRAVSIRVAVLLSILIVPACSPDSEREAMGWKVTADGLQCSGADELRSDGSCVWHCRDFSHQDNADLTIRHDGEHLQMQITPSEHC